MGVLDRFSLAGRTALVTGGGTGIGKALAVGFAEAGADVVVCGRTQATLDDTAAAIEAAGQRALALTADVTKADEVNALIDQIVSAWGRLDIACNNAGVNNWVEAAEMSEEDWDWIYDTNVKGAFLCSQAEGRAMMAAGRGSIINLASISARITNRPQPQSHYNSSKAALVQLSKSMAAEWASHGVRVNSLSPGYTRTEMADAPAPARPSRSGSATRRWAGWPRWRNCRAPRCSWPPTPRRTSPATT